MATKTAKASRVSAGFGHDTTTVNGLTVYTSTIRTLIESPMYYAIDTILFQQSMSVPNSTSVNMDRKNYRDYVTFRWADTDRENAQNTIQCLNLAKAMVLEMEAWRLRIGDFRWEPHWLTEAKERRHGKATDLCDGDDLPF